jgi:hypothetical protein
LNSGHWNLEFSGFRKVPAHPPAGIFQGRSKLLNRASGKLHRIRDHSANLDGNRWLLEIPFNEPNTWRHRRDYATLFQKGRNFFPAFCFGQRLSFGFSRVGEI